MKPFNALPALVAALALSSPCAAQDKPNWRRNGVLDVQELCAGVMSQTLENEPQHDSVLYMYQSEIYDAAGVVRRDTEAQVNAKVRKLLNANMPRLLCTGIGAVPNNGNLLKTAVSRMSDDFIDYVLEDWKLDLNQVDAVDGRTVLEHIALKRDSYRPDQAPYRIFQRYYERFRAAGAKTRAELEASGAVSSIAATQQRMIAELAAKAEAGDFESARVLFGAYDGREKLSGQTITRDAAAAQRWRKRAEAIALAGNAVFPLMSMAATYEIYNDPATAAVWYDRAARRGNREAMRNLGIAYALGKGVPKDLPRALSYMEQADGQDPAALSLLWAGSINEWLGHPDQQLLWYRYAWQQGVRTFPVPGYAPPPVPQSPLGEWFRMKHVSECGPTIKGDRSC
jgi:hypothetical protein